MPRENVREAGLDADAGEAEHSRFAPLRVLVELVLAEQRVGRRERHRHVEIRDAGVERGREERRVEARVASVEHRVGLLGAQQLGDGRGVGRVDLRRGEAVVDRRRALRAREIDVGENEALDEVATRGDRRCRSAHSPGSDDDDFHRVCGKPRSTRDVAGSGQRDVTTLPRV